MYKLTFIALLIGALFVTGCGDKCDDVDCGPNGTCVDGTCNCDPGYSGATCNINVCDDADCVNGTCDPVTGACDCEDGYVGDNCNKTVVDEYLGRWLSDDFGCDGTIEGLELEIVQGEDANTMIFQEPVATSDDAFFTAVWVDETTFNIPNQMIIDGIASGGGTLVNGVLKWNIVVIGDGFEADCCGTFMKQ